MNIYRFERRVWLAIEGAKGIKESAVISAENKDYLLKYAKFVKASGKSLPRQDKLIRTVKKLAEYLGPVDFMKATRDDLVNALAKVEGTDNTKADYQKITKQFYAWLFGVEDPRHEGYPKVVSWIRTKEPKPTLKSSDLLSPLEVKQLMATTTDIRLKALIQVCYECGLRIGEALHMHVGDVQIEENCAILSVNGKTGPRNAYSIESLPVLCQWLDNHPNRNNPEAWLWTEDTEPLTYDKARFLLNECRRKAKISKRVFWHLFRHSSATSNAELGEPMLRQIYGWSKNSSEPETYIHLHGEQVKKALLRKKGITQKTEKKLLMIECPRCKTLNEPNATLCFKCKSVLNLQNALSFDSLQKKLESFETLKEEVSDLRQALQTFGMISGRDPESYLQARKASKIMEKKLKDEGLVI